MRDGYVSFSLPSHSVYQQHDQRRVATCLGRRGSTTPQETAYSKLLTMVLSRSRGSTLLHFRTLEHDQSLRFRHFDYRGAFIRNCSDS